MRPFLAVLLALPAFAAQALTPLTPRLSPPTRTGLQAGLGRAGLPEVAHSSVEIALTQALGFEPASGPVHYADPYPGAPQYPHLPLVEGRAERVSERCTQVRAFAWLRKDTRAQAVTIEGTYCLVGAAEWSSDNQVVTRPNPP